MKARSPHVRLSPAVGLLVVTLVASCAHYTAGFSPADKPSPARSYLYGRFHIDAPRAVLGMDGHQTMGFAIRCDDGSEYTIRFSRENRVEVIAASPARCALNAVVFSDADGVVKARKRALGDPPDGFVVAAGSAYYLGDYFAESTFKSSWKVVYTEFNSSWRLSSANDNYDVTSAEMKRTFTTLAGLPTENRMILPRKHVPGDARKHKGAARSGPNEIVSPERAARLASFTKRRYATPAECEASCPDDGDCFPFRGDDGPAMTCVVHCKTDKDCPQGLACNCPAGDGPECRLIARTPNDAMAGICLSVEPAGQRR